MIAAIALLIALFLAALTGSWIAWVVGLGAAAWVAWVTAGRVMERVVSRPLHLDDARPKRR